MAVVAGRPVRTSDLSALGVSGVRAGQKIRPTTTTTIGHPLLAGDKIRVQHLTPPTT